MTKKRFLVTVILSLLMVTMLIPNLYTVAYATTQEFSTETTFVQKGIVIRKNVNFREEAGTSSKVIKKVQNGTEVIILEEVGQWLKVEIDKTEGYLYKEYVKILTCKGIVTAFTLNVRNEPTTESEVIGAVYKGMKVTILDEITTSDIENPKWLYISYNDGTSFGYVTKRYVKVQTNSDGTYLKTRVTTAQALNVRAEPSSNSDIIDWLQEGTNVIVWDYKETLDDRYTYWYKVEYNDGEGWIAGEHTKEQNWVLLTTAKTNSSGSARDRNHNMKLATEAINGTVVLPGGFFSWLDTMESCSFKKGYREATVYINGEKAKGSGGGVCQVSTTMNMAVKKAGIPTNAELHSLPVSYAKKSDEASVSYPNLDFSFGNILDSAILLELTSNGGQVVCNIYVAEIVTE